MKRSVKILIAFLTALAIILGGIALGSRERRAEAMYGGAVLVYCETGVGDGR